MSAEMTVRIDGTVPVTGGAGVAITTQAGPPRVIPAAALAYGQNTATDSVTPVLVYTVPAGKTFVGYANVIANSRATTAAYMTAALVVAGTNAVPADTTKVVVAGSSRDAGACPVTVPIQVTAPAGNSVAINLVLSTATTSNGSGFVFGELV